MSNFSTVTERDAEGDILLMRTVPASETTLTGVITIRDLMNRLLDVNLDAKFGFNLQEYKTHPILTNGYHYLSVDGEVLWFFDNDDRAKVNASQPLPYRDDLAVFGRQETTVRNLILHLANFDPNQEIALIGHFYSQFKIVAVNRYRTTAWNHFEFAPMFRVYMGF